MVWVWFQIWLWFMMFFDSPTQRAVMASGASSSASSLSTYGYDVFLSFRNDTRFGFTGNLYNALTMKGIKTFIDDVDLDGGKEIAQALVHAIQGSRIAIVVLSKNYAFSSFCLDELVNVMECRYHKNQLVIPVFYDVDPSHVREQKGTYGEAFARHENRLIEGSTDEEKLHYYNAKMRMQQWRITLARVANLSGYHFQPGYGFERDHIMKIVEDVSTRIKLDSQLQNKISLLGDLHINLESGIAPEAAHHCKYDVFLSFRKETRFGFTGNLYSALKQRGITAFIADMDLVKGTEIAPALVQAIERSRIAIVVLSENYASSSFCLEEIVKIMECRWQKNQLVIPVFYDVEPYQVREHKGAYGEALAAHENKFKGNSDEEKLHYYEMKIRVQKWRATLSLVASLSGYHFQQGHGYEPDHIMKIVKDVSAWTKLDFQLQNSISFQSDLHVSLEGKIAEAADEAFKYDVFLSFRKETRFGFTENLYSALKDREISAFIADLDLVKGTEIASALVKAIERSKSAIVVLSKNYAFSSFCLDELVGIIDSLRGKGGLVIPIFYDVDPFHVRHQRETYGEAMAVHEDMYKDNPHKVKQWRKALKQLADLSGYHFTPGLYEHKFIAKIVERVSTEIRRGALPVNVQQSGLDSEMPNVTSLLDFGSNDLCMKRIREIMSGMGQSTSLILKIMADCAHHVANNTNDAIVPSIANVAIATTAPTATAVTYAKPFPDISIIEIFEGRNFKRWQEQVLSLLNMHGVAEALTNLKPESSAGQKKVDDWIHANKVCRHTILSTLSDELFDVYCSYKEANKIWESMVVKYSVEDGRRQRFVIEKYYRWEMIEDKDIQFQINEYNKLLENLKAENIILQDEFVSGMLIDKLPDSWKDYKQQLKHENNPLSMADVIKHIIMEDNNRKNMKETRAKAPASKENA